MTSVRTPARVPRATALFAAALLISSLSSAAPAAQREMGAASPEALVARMKAAAAKQDIAELAACMSPKTRTEMAMGMYLGATMMVAFSQMGLEMGEAMAEGMAEGMAEAMGGTVSEEDRAKAEASKKEARAQADAMREGYNALVAKYGLPQLPAEGEPETEMPQEEAERVFAALDQGAFAADVIRFLESLPGDEPKPSADEASPVRIPDGPLENLAIEGDAATGTVGGETLRFVRIDGRWYVEEPEGESGEEGIGGEERFE